MVVSANGSCNYDARRHARDRCEEALLWLHTGGCIVTLVFGLFLVPVAAQTQPAGTVPRIGVLVPGPPPSTPDWKQRSPLLQALHELGYVEGQNMALEYRFTGGGYDPLPELAADLVRVRVNVIVTYGTVTTQAAMHVTTTIPIVMANSVFPVETGLVASLAQPGGNVTGVAAFGPEQVGKALAILKEAVPGLSRLGVFWDPENPAAVIMWRQTQVDARALGLTLSSLEVPGSMTLERLFAAITQARPDALSVSGDNFPSRHQQEIADFAVKSGLPTLGSRSFVERGGLISYGAGPLGMPQRVAYYVDRILKGAKPADLPVERPMKFTLVINLKTAKALGITMPPSLLLLADEVIQ
jgi:putative ABC transport system substrate-binding protein